jgi:MaoC like domain
MTKRYLEDFATGQTFGSGRVRVDGERIKIFAAEFDPQLFHLDDEAARDTVFRGLAASGWYTAALTMKNVMRTLLAAAAFVVAGAAAQAADIAPVTGDWTKLGTDRSALVYYIDEPDGFHVVVTTQQGLTDRAAVVRFETVLAAGQSAAVSVPRGVGEEPARIVFSNAGDHLHIAKPNAAVSAR